MHQSTTPGHDSDLTTPPSSLWFGTFVPPTFPSYSGRGRAEVCVIGGGITGLMTAYLLTKAGKKVTVLDAGSLGAGESGRTGGHASCVVDDRIQLLERAHGDAATRAIVAARRAAIDTLEAIVQAEKLDCDFRRVDGYLVAGAGDAGRMLDEELAAARRAGLTEVTKLSAAPDSSVNAGPALRFPNQAQAHVLKLMAGLASAVVLGGGRVYSDSLVLRVESGEPCTVTTNDGYALAADIVCVCTNASVGGIAEHSPVVSACPAFTVAAFVPRDTLLPALYWDTLDPCHYVRVQPIETPKRGRRKVQERDALLVSGEYRESEARGDDEAHWRRLEEWMRARWPAIDGIAYRWASEVAAPADGATRIGRPSPATGNVYVARGASGRGLTHGVLAGTLLSDLIIGRPNALAAVYDPARAADR